MEDNKVCNVCGKHLEVLDRDPDYTIGIRMGYGTDHDLEYAEIHMCCECLDKLVGSCVVNPIVGEYDIITGEVTRYGA